MKLSDLLYPNEYTSEFQAEEIEIRSLTDHTDDVGKGDVFICVQGKHFDPRLLLSHLLSCGVAAVVLEKQDGISIPSALPCFFVKNAAETAAFMWSRYYGSPESKMRMIGITGTNGKTTTAVMLMHIMQKSGKSCGYIGTLGVYQNGQQILTEDRSTMTTPSPRTLYRTLSVLQESGVKTVIMEVSSHSLIQHRCAPILFDMALFTNLSPEHLDYHQSMEEYYQAKKILFTQAKTALINTDDEYGERLSKEVVCPKETFGILYPADNHATDLCDNRASGTIYTYIGKNNTFSVCLSLPGNFQIYNALLAIGIALRLEIPIPIIQNALCSMPCVKGRMEYLKFDDISLPYSVLIDYAHTPAAIQTCLASVRRMTSGRVIVVFGAGGERDKQKRPLMGKAVSKLADFAFITSDNSRNESTCSIIKDILTGIAPTLPYRVVTDRKKAIEAALDAATPEDTVVLLGKGHETYEWGKNGLSPFSEREIVYAYLKKLKHDH